MLEVKPEKDHFLTLYEKFESTVSPSEGPWLKRLRKAAITRFKELGFPGPRNEDWKFTNLAPLQKVPFQLAGEKVQDGLAMAIQPFDIGDAHQLVFVNGYFNPELSNITDLPGGAIVSNLKSAIQEHPELTEKHLAQYADYDSLALTALNTAFFEDGTFIHLKAGTVLEKPVHIVNLSVASEDPVAAFPRHLFVAEKSSQATIVESHIGLPEQVYFNNPVVEIFADENSNLDHYKIQRESLEAFHLANMQVKQLRNSNVSSHYIALGGKLVRHEARTKLDDEGCECTFNGLYLGRGKQHIDNHTVIDHAKPHCDSHELYKGLLDDKGSGVFNGKIFVREDAQKTDAKQTNQVLLLSDDATINTKPQLEIFADDVKCTHGATVGQLDEPSLFYLRTRGISLEQARSLLIFAFANDIIQRIKVDSIRGQLEEVLLSAQQLPRFQEYLEIE